MMICPETFYEINLKDKSKEEIERVIRKLKREIKNLKDFVEHPDYAAKKKFCPSEYVKINMNRDYLARAIITYIEAGGDYVPSKAEQKAMDFDANIPYIEKVVFSIGGYFGGYKTKTYTVDGDKIHIDLEYTPDCNPLALYESQPTGIGTEEFFNAFEGLHIGEWRRNYDTSRFGFFVMDGTQWNLKIYFSNGRKAVKISGSNAYPYNFDRLLDLFEMEAL